MSDLASALTFLKLIGTSKIKHSNRNLYEHLANTSGLLQQWLEPEDVQLAGLFHSIYGTSQFHTCAFPIEGRHIIKQVIGDRAESLAYMFCLSDRSKFPWAPAVLSDNIAAELYTIEAANLIEQKDDAPYVARLLNVPLSENSRKAVMNYISQ